GLQAGLAAVGTELPAGRLVGVVIQQAGASGRVLDARGVVAEAKEAGGLVTVATDLLALTLLVSPGELRAGISVGSAQRFGVPLFFGGPHAAYMAVRKGLERQLPGRLVGVSIDVDGAAGYRLALATREQHIRREKATSNICTAQALLAIVASMYAVYHGPEGLRAIAERVRTRAVTLASALRTAGVTVEHDTFFDTVRLAVPGRAQEIARAAADAGYNLYVPDTDHVQVSTDETTTPADVEAVAATVLRVLGLDAAPTVDAGAAVELPAELTRTTGYLAHPIFHSHRSETSMLRYLRKLSDKDLALDRTMIPLGSCTMKLNATAEMEAISWPGFADIHPYAPADQTQGYAELVSTLEAQLAEITGYAAVS